MISTSAFPPEIVNRATLGARLKRFGPAAPGVHEQSSTEFSHQWPVSVTINHHIGIIAICQTRGCWTPTFVPMTHVNTHPIDVHRDLGGQLRVTGWIGVAEHGPDWGDQSQLIENTRSTHVPRVENQRHSLESLVNAGPQESVGI